MLTYIRELLAGFNIPQFSLPAVRFTDIVDILIVAFLIYIFVNWIRQTRAWSLFKGIAVILAIAAVAYVFNLVTVTWVVQNTFTMGLLAVVILFQPEFRKALEQIGRRRLFASFSEQRGRWFSIFGARPENRQNAHISVHTVSEVVKAARQMAAARTGALIVLEQEVPLGDHEHTGIPVDALVSSQLLVNIFEKNTPLHDGAVIISQNRVAAAACILPLTSEEIGHDLGTRHRAALGISEVSDAMVVVVSEETGGISAAVGGGLTLRLNENQLRDLLLLKEESGEKPRRVRMSKGKRDKRKA